MNTRGHKNEHTWPSNLSRALQKTWGEFAKRGNPNNNSITHWPRFSNKDRPELRWNKYVEVVQKYR